MQEPKEDALLVSEAARLAGTSTDLMRLALDRGDVAGFRTASGLRVFDRASVEAFAAKRQRERRRSP